MSKKGQKGRSKRKASVPERRAVPSASSEMDLARAASSASPRAATPPGPAPDLDAVAMLHGRPPIETPIAFEAPSGLSAAGLSADSPDLDSSFFASDPHASHRLAPHDPHDASDEPDERDPRMRLKLAPETAKRRAQLQKYVKVAVGAASVLCLAALVKVAVAHNHEEPVAGRAAASLQSQGRAAALPLETAQAAAERPPSPSVVLGHGLAAEDPGVAAPAAAPPTPSPIVPLSPTLPSPPIPPAEPVVTAAPEPAAAPLELDPKAAAKEKHASQLALERGKAGDAIAAGERSVALDPTDAEAWLILGAAYQAKGDAPGARRSFKACLEHGKRGPRWECAQMPH